MNTTSTILVADDDRGIRTVLAQALGRAGYEVRTTGNASTLWRWVSEGEGDLVITDVVMPDESGLDLLPRIKKIRPDMRIIVMSAQNTLLTAVKATQRGAFEYLPKPFDLKELVAVVNRALSTPRNHPSDGGNDQDEDEKLPLIGRSPAMQEIYRTLARLMGTDLTVMITGESGTGKELVARALHNYGKRRNGPFVAINMAAIPRELIESELFGHEKGAFTGATQRAAGRFEQAEGGTLFLDAIGDMPPGLQTRLLRVLQDHQVVPLGGGKPIAVDFALIAATHQPLKQAVAEGRFRTDLYYRLNGLSLTLPPLRQRGDRLALAANLLRQIEPERALGLSDRVAAAVESDGWPGTIRQRAGQCPAHRLCPVGPGRAPHPLAPPARGRGRGYGPPPGRAHWRRRSAQRLGLPDGADGGILRRQHDPGGAQAGNQPQHPLPKAEARVAFTRFRSAIWCPAVPLGGRV